MVKETVPFVVADLSAFTRNLQRAFADRTAEGRGAPTYIETMNLVARAAGFKNVQALKARPPEAPPPRAALPLSENARRALMCFDAEGRLVRWPMKFTLQNLAAWVLWTRFEAKRIYHEREVDALLKASNAFGDHVTLRRRLIDLRLLARNKDGSEYRKLAARPDDEIRALLAAWRERVRSAKKRIDPSRRPGGA